MDYVRENPTEFGYSRGQFEKMQAVMFGAANTYWKFLLTMLAAKCETFVYTAHLRREFTKAGTPTGRLLAKAKGPLEELASLVLKMDRPIDKKGHKTKIPIAVVEADRLVGPIKVLENGLCETDPCMPACLPQATPWHVRQYMQNPPNLEKPKRGETAEPEPAPTEMDLEQARLARAEAEQGAEALRLDRARLAQQAAERVNRRVVETVDSSTSDGHLVGQDCYSSDCYGVPVDPPAEYAAKAQSFDAPATAEQTAAGNGERARPEQLQSILHLRTALEPFGMTKEIYVAAIKKRGVASAREMTVPQAADFIDRLRAMLIAKQRAAEESIEPHGVPFDRDEVPAGE
jgi:hypothetical protein